MEQQHANPEQEAAAACEEPKASVLSPVEAMAVEVEAAIAHIEQRYPEGISPVERVQICGLREACRQLRACTVELDRDGVMVAGSMGQRRAHPLLKVAAELRKEIHRGLWELTIAAQNRQTIEQSKRLRAAARAAAEAGEALARSIRARARKTGKPASQPSPDRKGGATERATRKPPRATSGPPSGRPAAPAAAKDKTQPRPRHSSAANRTRREDPARRERSP